MLQPKKASEVRKNNDWHYRECSVLYIVQGCGHLVAVVHKSKCLCYLEDKRIWDNKDLGQERERRASKETGKCTSVPYFIVMRSLKKLHDFSQIILTLHSTIEVVHHVIWSVCTDFESRSCVE